MLRKTRHAVCCGAALILMLGNLMGTPLALLQGLAWAQMVVTYSAEDGLKQGVADTFSGKKPCSMCKVIKKSSQPASHSVAVRTANPEFRLIAPAPLAQTPSNRQTDREYSTYLRLPDILLNDTPPVPPPRGV